MVARSLEWGRRTVGEATHAGFTSAVRAPSTMLGTGLAGMTVLLILEFVRVNSRSFVVNKNPRNP